jgi:hypothetical protein
MSGVPKAAIARRLGIRRATIVSWLTEESYTDDRGWARGKRRTHTDEEVTRIVTLKQHRITTRSYLQGAEHIQMDYAIAHPTDALPSLWFIGDVFRQHGLQTKRPTPKRKRQGIVERLKYPIKTIIGLGTIQQAADFVGKRWIAGRSEPITIFSTCYYQWLKQFRIWRTGAETSEHAIRCLSEFWCDHPLANVLRIDNGMQFRGTGRGIVGISRFLKFLLNLNVTPLFSSPYQSYTNPHIEGNNRTVGDLWSANHFTGTDMLDGEIGRFNAEHEAYVRWKFRDRLMDASLRYIGRNEQIETEVLRSTQGKKVAFIRFVERWKERGDRIGIVLLNRFVCVPDPFLGQYVLASINLETATLSVIEEHDGMASIVLTAPFPYSL